MLYIVATPIGNLKDITLRALEVLRDADYVVCEDTRRTGVLLRNHDIKKPMVSYYEKNKNKRLPYIMSLLKDNKDVCLVSDAGIPCLSDPGFLIVRGCITEGIDFTVIPGAEAVIPALVISGFPPAQFMFTGFLPHKAGRRKKALEKLKELQNCSLVLYESPYRILKLLQELQAVMPERTVCLVRELTKIHEEVIRGTPQELYQNFSSRQAIKGEFVVIIAPEGFRL